ncbi:MAG: hypothetical protein AAF557_21955 [Pseudomonadota bacterium]
MSEKTPKPDHRSYGFTHAGDLPGDWGLFTKEADKARAAFEDAHNAQIPPAMPEPHARVTSGQMNPVRPRAVLTDPHPAFAVPSRRRQEEEWLQSLKTERDGRVLSREDFKRLRTRQDKGLRRVRGRG